MLALQLYRWIARPLLEVGLPEPATVVRPFTKSTEGDAAEEEGRGRSAGGSHRICEEIEREDRGAGMGVDVVLR